MVAVVEIIGLVTGDTTTGANDATETFFRLVGLVNSKSSAQRAWLATKRNLITLVFSATEEFGLSNITSAAVVSLVFSRSFSISALMNCRIAIRIPLFLSKSIPSTES